MIFERAREFIKYHFINNIVNNLLLIIQLTVILSMSVFVYSNTVKAESFDKITGESLASQKRFIAGKIVDHYERISDIVEVTDDIHLNIKCDTRIVPMIIPGRQARRSTVGETLAGAAIGGVVGKLLTNDDKGAIGGAIIGGLATQDSQRSDTIVYREVSECRDAPKYKLVTKDEYSHSTINFTLDGISYEAKFIKYGNVKLLK